MNLDLGRVLSRAFSITWRHRWLWLLGVFGGIGIGGGSGSFNSGSASSSSPHLGQFVADHLALVLAAVAVLVVIGLSGLLVTCVAVPAAVWAGLQLDAGHQVGLRMAWREGRSRFWRYLRLVLLKALLTFAVVTVSGLLVALGAGVYSAAGNGIIPFLVLAAILLVALLVAVAVVLSFAMLWSDRLLVILGHGAVDSLRAGWWLFRHNKLATVILWLVVGGINLGIGLAIALVAGVVSIPGGLLIALFFIGDGAPTWLAILGFTWVALLGGGVLLVGAGFVGAFTEVAFALAARDLTLQAGLPALPEVIGWDPAQDPPRFPAMVPAT